MPPSNSEETPPYKSESHRSVVFGLLVLVASLVIEVSGFLCRSMRLEPQLIDPVPDIGCSGLLGCPERGLCQLLARAASAAATII